MAIGVRNAVRSHGKGVDMVLFGWLVWYQVWFGVKCGLVNLAQSHGTPVALGGPPFANPRPYILKIPLHGLLLC